MLVDAHDSMVSRKPFSQLVEARLTDVAAARVQLLAAVVVIPVGDERH
ncbi:MAG: hypothetical protein JSV42_05865 [Chloroflexota bacterium]|nr:MAG: hypothetical protein JSV42_05865 [Chloroflexota bacterium]